ncbi:MAG: alkaline phosphatase [Gammaproteobacteria bacterium]
MKTPLIELIIRISWILTLSLPFSGCSPSPTRHPIDTPIKNVVLIIGDGMGPQQVGLLLSYARQAPHGVLPSRTTAFDRLLERGRLGLSLTHADGTLVTDSAASATQLATGFSAGSEMIGLDRNGDARESIVEKAARLGKATGLVSDTRITHATPAAFAAHQSHRSMENEIAEDLLRAGPDVLFSAGLNYWLPQQVNDPGSAPYRDVDELTGHRFTLVSKRNDDRNLLEKARNQGYRLVFDKDGLDKTHGKTLGLFAGETMPDGMTENRTRNDPQRTVPTLSEMAVKALDILAQNDNGFFLMVEAGQIDWAGHRNDTGLLLHEMLRMNDMLHRVLDWAEAREDTLLIVTADHETGGFGFSYSAADIPPPRRLPGAFFGDERNFQPGFNFGNPDILDMLYRQQLSYADLFRQFDALPKARQTPAELKALVDRYSAFPITEVQAETVLATEPNPLYRPGHKTLGDKIVPKMDVNGAFFVYQRDNRENLLAGAVAAGQQAVWSTGTHTSTPVYVFVQGPRQSLKPFAKILHHTDIGRLAIEALQ